MVSTIQWWCSARGVEWDWSWQAYPGIWLVVALLAVWAWRTIRARGLRHADSGELSGKPSGERRRVALLIAGVVLLWLTLDWPVGPLGTGYLASVHAVQFVSLAMVVPPMLLMGLEREQVARWVETRPVQLKILTAITHPLVAAIIFTLVMIVTHVPTVVDALMKFQLGAMTLDLTWLISGLAFWWPVVVRVPERRWFAPPLRTLYLFFGTQAHLFIAMWLMVSEYPVYGTYELAPRVSVLSALQDQQVAGGIMLTVGGPFVLAVISVILFRWFAESEREQALEEQRLRDGVGA
jgi:putative membrane protein